MHVSIHVPGTGPHLEHSNLGATDKHTLSFRFEHKCQLASPPSLRILSTNTLLQYRAAKIRVSSTSVQQCGNICGSFQISNSVGAIRGSAGRNKFHFFRRRYCIKVSLLTHISDTSNFNRQGGAAAWRDKTVLIICINNIE